MEQEKELINLFRKMDPETRDIYLSHGRIALVAEEAGRKAVLGRLSPLVREITGAGLVPGPAA
jgi:hypothetical protein